MKNSSSDFLVILVLLITLIAGGVTYQLKKPRKLVLYDVPDVSYVEITLAQDETVDEDFPCYRVDLK